MHKTVFEFLHYPEVWKLKCLQINDPGFECEFLLSALSLNMVKLTIDQHTSTHFSTSSLDSWLGSRILEALVYVAQPSVSTSGQVRLLKMFSDFFAGCGPHFLSNSSVLKYAKALQVKDLTPFESEVKTRSTEQRLNQLTAALAAELGLVDFFQDYLNQVDLVEAFPSGGLLFMQLHNPCSTIWDTLHCALRRAWCGFYYRRARILKKFLRIDVQCRN